jgi:hypothetical protein
MVAATGSDAHQCAGRNAPRFVELAAPRLAPVFAGMSRKHRSREGLGCAAPVRVQWNPWQHTQLK